NRTAHCVVWWPSTPSMLRKPQSHIQRSAKIFGKYFLLFELTLFSCSYLLYRRMNRSQEFRYYMHNNYPTVLEGYYKIGETISQSKIIRETDLMAFEKKLPKPIHKYEPTLNKSNRAPMSNNSTESSTDQSNISDVKKESKTAGK
ncbi:hypothetical protein PV325_000291, partial [Microctonus aethiopoides]